MWFLLKGFLCVDLGGELLQVVGGCDQYLVEMIDLFDWCVQGCLDIGNYGIQFGEGFVQFVFKMMFELIGCVGDVFVDCFVLLCLVEFVVQEFMDCFVG